MTTTRRETTHCFMAGKIQVSEGTTEKLVASQSKSRQQPNRSPSGKILVLIKVPQKNWRHPNKNLNTGKNPGILMGVIIQCRSLSGTNYRCAQFTGIHPHRLAHEPA